jgi:tripartite-type tricarboxylate transporter receptor subunit TctC
MEYRQGMKSRELAIQMACTHMAAVANLGKWGVFAGIFLAMQTITPAGAQDYPTRPVTIVIPFTPGGSTDLLGRMVAKQFEERWNATFLVDNKPGAGGLIAATAVSKTVPDGYTLMMAPSGTMSTNVTLYKQLPYDPLTDFIPIAVIARTPFVLVVNPELPIHSVQDFIKYAKEKDGNLSYATVGPGQPHHLFGELFKTVTGIKMAPVPYRGSLPAATDVAAGHVPVMFVDVGPSLGLIRAGKLRVLGTSTKARVAALPHTPSIADGGVPEFDAASWQMLISPAKTPRPIVEKLHNEIKSFLAFPETNDFISKNGMVPYDNPSVEELQAFVRSEVLRWGKIVQAAGIAYSQ